MSAPYRTSIRDDGAVVEVWGSRCWCGFETGLARVTLGTRSILLSGAGCQQRPRRGVDEAEAWAATVRLA